MADATGTNLILMVDRRLDTLAPISKHAQGIHCVRHKSSTLGYCLGLDLLRARDAHAGGFSCLESGLARSKNSINVAIKNFIDFCISSLVFWLWGYAVMFGDSQHGLFGTSGFCFSAQHSSWLLTFFLFQLVFCGTSTTILSGAVAERIRFWAYLACVTFTSGLIYPLVGHWAWGGAATGEKTGWLAQLGFLDFAGSTVVHAVGGSISLAGCLVLGQDSADSIPKKLPCTATTCPWPPWARFSFGLAGSASWRQHPRDE